MSIHNVARTITLAAACTMVPATALAQQIGVKGGINFASLTPEEDEDPDTSRRRGPVGGVWVGTPLGTGFSLQVEGLFSEKGVTFNALPIAEVGKADVRVRYVEFPVLARRDFGTAGSGARLFVLGGAAPAFKLSARTRAEFEGEEQTRDIGDEIKPFDLGLVGGVGVEFGRAVVEGRYTHGLLHINEDDNGDEDRIKNRVFSVMFGFRFN